MRKIILFTFTLLLIFSMTCTAFANNPVYSTWAEPYIKTAETVDILPDSLKSADLTANITREEFAELSVKLYEKLNNQKIEAYTDAIRFVDCESPEIIKAASIGIINGVSVDRFEPNGNLTRAQGATMLTRAYKKYTFVNWALDKDTEFENEFINSFRTPMQFDDADNLDSRAISSIAFMRARSIIDGVGDNRFNSNGHLTREQAVKIAVKMLSVIGNHNFAPANAFIVDSIRGSSIYTWLENGQTVIALYDTDGHPVKSFRTAVRSEEYYAQLCRSEYSHIGWYSGLAGLYRLQDGDLVQISSKPVKDLLFVRSGPQSSGSIILTWSDDTDIISIYRPADTIVNVDCDGHEAVLLSADDAHGIEIAGLDAEDSIIAFYTENAVGMGHYDSYRYVLLSAPSGIPLPGGEGKNIFVTDFTAGRPEIMEGFSFENPEGYKMVSISMEMQRLKNLSLAH